MRMSRADRDGYPYVGGLRRCALAQQAPLAIRGGAVYTQSEVLR
jgi:hypothetical protein